MHGAVKAVPVAFSRQAATASGVPTSGPLVDAFGRVHTDLRISVTDRCNLRCVYCMPEEGVAWLPRSEILTFEEIERIAGVARRLGVDSVRLTGGEPLVRAGITDLVARLGRIGFSDLSMTSNGTGLARLAPELVAAGLHRVNISCDSLRPERFAEIRRRGSLSGVLEAMDAAEAAGLPPVKVNVVVIAGVNDDEIVDLAAFGRDTGRIGPLHRVHAPRRRRDLGTHKGRLRRGDPGSSERRVAARASERAIGRPGAGRSLPLRRRSGRDRRHHERLTGLLWFLQPPAAHRRRRHPKLPFRKWRAPRP